jgi:tetratricopeptide (TPR) repeat protein
MCNSFACEYNDILVFNMKKPHRSLSVRIRAGQILLLTVGWSISFLVSGCALSPPRLDYSRYSAEELNDFGVVYESAGNLPEAQRAYSEALEKDPNNYVAASNLGNICYQNGKYERAFAYYRKALNLCPGYVPALNNLANAQIETKDYAGATENLQKALELAETEEEKRAIYLSLATLHECVGDKAGSADWTEKADEMKSPTIISDVPFFKQSKYNCGPAALASVYNFLGVPQAVEEISKRIYSREQKGSLNLQLLIDAREQGLTATMYSGSFQRIKEAVNEKIPLILMISAGGDSLHYVVVVGYEGYDPETILVHDGYEPHKKYEREMLDKKWRATGYCTIEISN